MADTIYRFLDSDGALKTLVAGKFRVGLISKFNDPFEWKLGFRGIPTPEEKERADHFHSKQLRALESRMRVLCFSGSFSPPVLWSIYAEKHRGVAFEVKHPWPVDTLQEMTYFPERPVLDFDRLHEIRDETTHAQYHLKLINGLMRNKSPGFFFEQEYRLQIGLESCQHRDGHDE